MALLTTYDESNRVITDGLIVSYETQLTFGRWVQISQAGGAIIKVYDKVWTTTRKATKRYKYVGMDLETAQDCAEEMISKYTRDFKTSVWKNLDGDFEHISGGSRCMAKVGVRYVQGGMYDVDIEVDEVDTRTTINEGSKTLFTTEDSRDYDGEGID